MWQEAVMELLRLWEEAVMESRIRKKGIMKSSRMWDETDVEYLRFYLKFDWWN